MIRVQIDLSPQAYKHLLALQKKGGFLTIAATVRASLRLLEWTQIKSDKNEQICSRKSDGTYIPLEVLL